MIYVTLGTMHMNFDRLVRAMDAYAAESGARVVMQTGMSTVVPEHCEHFDFKSREECLEIQRDADLVVCHGGIGSVIDALSLEKPLIVVPRLKKFGEHNDDHQLDLARAVERRGWGRCVEDVETLAQACAEPPEAYVGYRPAKDALIGEVRGVILE